jgi:hypothetical protein
MADKLAVASEIIIAVAFGTFLWGLPYHAAAVAALGVALSGYRRLRLNQA